MNTNTANIARNAALGYFEVIVGPNPKQLMRKASHTGAHRDRGLKQVHPTHDRKRRGVAPANGCDRDDDRSLSLTRE
jgi:hypothetical protein